MCMFRCTHCALNSRGRSVYYTPLRDEQILTARQARTISGSRVNCSSNSRGWSLATATSTSPGRSSEGRTGTVEGRGIQSKLRAPDGGRGLHEKKSAGHPRGPFTPRRMDWGGTRRRRSSHHCPGWPWRRRMGTERRRGRGFNLAVEQASRRPPFGLRH